jgi:hypothetical protein
VSENPFSTNPYSSPSAVSEHYLPPNSFALDAVRGPATGLLVVSCVWLVILCASLLINVVMTILVLTGNIPGAERNLNPNVGPAEMLTVVPGIMGAVLQLGLHSLVLYGALQMRKLRSIGFAYAAAIISCIPFCSGCYLIGIPFGVWALVTLNKPEVSGSFR